jgi:hypothetical protein
MPSWVLAVLGVIWYFAFRMMIVSKLYLKHNNAVYEYRMSVTARAQELLEQGRILGENGNRDEHLLILQEVSTMMEFLRRVSYDDMMNAILPMKQMILSPFKFTRKGMVVDKELYNVIYGNTLEDPWSSF